MREVELAREVREDGRGVYVHFGGYRYRPAKSKKTSFVVGEEVCLRPVSDREPAWGSFYNYGARVYRNPEASEIWKPRVRR